MVKSIFSFASKIIQSRHFVNINSRIVLQVITQLLALAVIPVTSRALGPEKFGELAFASAINGVLLIAVDFGFNQYLLVKLSQSNHHKNIISEIVTLKVIIASVLYLLTFIITSSYGFSRSQLITIHIITLGIQIQSFNIGVYFLAQEKIFLNAIADLTGAAIKAILAITLIRKPEHITIYAFFVVLSAAVSVGLRLYLFKKNNPFQLSLKLLRPSREFLHYIKDAAEFGVSILFNKTSQYFIPIIIGLILTKHELGLYNGANRLFQVGLFGFSAVLTTFMPLIYKVNKPGYDQKQKAKILNKLFYMFFGLGIVTALMVFYLSEWAVQIILGNEFIVAAEILKLWAIIILVIPIAMFFQNIIIGQNKKRTYMVISLITNILTIVGGYALVQWLGFRGSYFILMITYATIFMGGTIYVLFNFNSTELKSMVNPYKLFGK